MIEDRGSLSDSFAHQRPTWNTIVKIRVNWRCASLRKQVLMREEGALDALRH
jgi:hypothetical protein